MAVVVLLFFLVAGVFKDVMNFRGVWVLVGVIWLLYVAPKLNHRTNETHRAPRPVFYLSL